MTESSRPVDEPSRLLVAACASIGVLALPQYLMALRMANDSAQIHVLLSENAERMLPRDSVAPFADEVHSPGMFWSNTPKGHIEYSDWPDLFVVMPASCDILARTAVGLSDKPIALMTASHPRPILFLPNMNKYLWEKATTRRNVDLLKADGHLFIEPLRAKAFAAAAGRFEEGLIMPPPQVTAGLIVEELARRSA